MPWVTLLLVGETETSVGGYPATRCLTFQVPLPADLPPGLHRVEVRIDDVRCDVVDPHTGAPYTEFSTANNLGRGRGRQFRVYPGF